MKKNAELLKTLNSLIAHQPAPLRREIEMVAHKLKYPMADILAKMKLGSVSEQARKLKVSRQTIYVWTSERYRPTSLQAKRIAKLTGVPIENIIDNGFEVKRDARRKANAKAARLAAKRRKIEGGDGAVPSAGRGTDADGSRSEAA